MSSIEQIRRWEEAPVDQTKEHFELRYGSGRSDPTEWSTVALVGARVDGTVNVQIVLPPRYANRNKIIFKVLKEIEFFLLEKGEENPWGYAQHHCGTLANCYGDVHWSFQEATSTGVSVDVLQGAVILEVGAEGGSITLFGNRDSNGEWWVFWLGTDELTLLELLSEEDLADFDSLAAAASTATLNKKMADLERKEVTDYMSQNIDEAMVLLEKYSWFAFVPLQVRPEFRKLVLDAVRQRGGPSQADRWSRHFRRWEAQERTSQDT